MRRERNPRIGVEITNMQRIKADPCRGIFFPKKPWPQGTAILFCQLRTIPHIPQRNKVILCRQKNHLFRPLASSPNRYFFLSPSNPPSRPKPSPSLPSPSSLTCRELTSMSINLSHFNYTPGPDRPRIRRGRGGRERGEGGAESNIVPFSRGGVLDI